MSSGEKAWEKPLSIEERVSLTKFNIHDKPHIIVKTDLCEKCRTKPCIITCPAGLFQIDENGKLVFIYEGCLECGACRVICPYEAVEWHYPSGGYGVWYRFG
ncbi:MAG: 4Fe-4S dicluster domain-containing protein [Pyrodictiaceae archaeon]